MIGIYKITSPNGRVYIGQSINLESRFKDYLYANCIKQKRLYASIVKHGIDNHIFEVVLECDECDLNKNERKFQDKYNVLGPKGLNCLLVGHDNISGKRSDDTKRKISIANSGKNNGMYGVKHTEEFREARRAYRHTPENIKKISQRSFRGNNPNAKLVLNLETGIFYDCVQDASDTIGTQRDTLKQWLNGRRRNKSNFIYA